MAHDYVYGVRLNNEGTATAFGTNALSVRILPEEHPGLRSTPTITSGRHGSTTAARSFYDSYDFILEIDLPWSTPAGVYTAQSNVLKRLTNYRERVWLTRTAPYHGTVEIPIIVMRGPRTTNPRNRLAIPCRTLDPFWRPATISFSSVNPVSGITNTGDAPINDGQFSFTGTNGIQRLTNTTTGDWIELNANTTALAIQVDVGAGTVKQVASHVDSVLTAANPWLMEIQPGANAFTLSGGGACVFSGYIKWL